MDYRGYPPEVLSKPEDPDLGLDIDGLSIESFIYADFEILIQFTGGFGTYGLGDDRVEIPPGCAEGEISFDHTEVSWDLDGHATERQVRLVVALLEIWRHEETPLHLCMSNSRMSMLIKDEHLWIPLP